MPAASEAVGMNVASIFRREWRKAEAGVRQRDLADSDAPRWPRPTALELAERPEMQATLEHYERVARIAARAGLADALPSGLAPAPGRVSRSEHVDAVGYIDLHSRSVGVDLICWHNPPAQHVDEPGWQMVFAWITGSDRTLRRVSLLTAPCRDGCGYVASYGYEADGAPGIGVLRVTALEDGAWRIVDCWGDATEQGRVYALAGRLAEA